MGAPKPTIAVSTRKRIVVTPVLKREFKSVKRSSPGMEFTATAEAFTRKRNVAVSATHIPQRMVNQANRSQNLNPEKNNRNLKSQKNTRNLKSQSESHCAKPPPKWKFHLVKFTRHTPLMLIFL